VVLTSILDFNRPVRYHPYLSYTKTIFDPTGETSSVIFRYYFNPTDYYPMSIPNPISLVRDGSMDVKCFTLWWTLESTISM